MGTLLRALDRLNFLWKAEQPVAVRQLPISSCDCGAYYMFKCSDCGECTQCMDEYYMLKDEVWHSAITARSKPSILCIGCVESRIGKLLTKDDFAPVPLNEMPFWPRSERLKTRLEIS
jgi:hypothetical protein